MEKATIAGPAPTVIKHIVMWDVRGQCQADKDTVARLIKTSFEALAGKIPGLLRVEVGQDISGVEYACDVVLYTEFSSPGALQDYASHPEHLRIKQLLGDSRIARHQVDYTVLAAAAGKERNDV